MHLDILIKNVYTGYGNLSIGIRNQILDGLYFLLASVSSVVEFPGAGSRRLRTINSELNGAT